MNSFAKTAAALAVGATLALAAPLAASAHVTVDPAKAEAGAYTVITVKVPNESDTAGTNRVQISLPTDTPFTSVRYVPVAGWTAELVKTTLPAPVTVGESTITEAVTSVIFTAEPGSEIQAGQLQLFPLSLGPVPDVGSVVLPVDQGYTDGSTVSWSEEGENAAKPAPVLYVNDTPAADHHAADHDGDGDENHEGVVAISDTTAAGSTTDVLARVLGIGGLVVAVVALVLLFALRRPAAK